MTLPWGERWQSRCVEVEAGSTVDKLQLFNLERELFVELAKTKQTRERIAYMLEFGRPLEN
ncbi:hypothetical protein HNR03_000261 [Pseudomonas sp. JAI111]|uniref:hypothetical protein n=1 Tax=Pseudomonas sp. JAI111 TaxID=2735913 RepID=UPI00216822DB|nr:hypothetical protein [Pseudomonas sp. JAI111]MCS3835681.1 hypothetical protein [Pseudomonas sp. JAI111]